MTPLGEIQEIKVILEDQLGVSQNQDCQECKNELHLSIISLWAYKYDYQSPQSHKGQQLCFLQKSSKQKLIYQQSPKSLQTSHPSPPITPTSPSNILFIASSNLNQHFDINYSGFHASLAIRSPINTHLRTIIRTLDNKLWEEIAYRAVAKMPKFKLLNQSNKILHDFVLINGHSNSQSKQNLRHEEERYKLKEDTLLVGGIKSIKQYKKYSKTEFSQGNQEQSQISASVPLNRQPQSLGKKCTKLFISESINEQEQNQQNLMRKTRMENIRFNKKVQDLKTETQFYNNERTQSEKKKLKESKVFTYDYEGKLLSTKLKNSTNIKFVNIKSKLHQHINKERHNLLQKLRSTQQSDVVEKKVIYYEGAEGQGVREERVNKAIAPNNNNSLNHLFKDNRSIQMGVSIVDIQNNSKLVGIHKQKLSRNSLKLSEFKRSFKSTSMIGKKASTMQKQKASESKASPTPKNTFRINTISDAQSKIIQSSLSRYSRRADKIIRNQKVFMQSFYNDHM